MSTFKANLLRTTLLGITLILTWLVYQPGLSGAFLFDDYPNILRNEAVAIDSLRVDELKHVVFSGTAGPLKRPVATLSFALNYYVAGFDSFWFKTVNLIIHCTNGVGIFLLTSLLLSAYQRVHGIGMPSKHFMFVSIVTSAAWLLHPLQLTSVLYVVQRMVELAAFFCIAGLILYCIGRLRQLKGQSGLMWIVCSVFVATPLATLSKENGILLPAWLAVVEIAVFRFKLKDRKRSSALIAMTATIILVPALTLLYVLTFKPEILLGGYQMRDFSLTERVLTETRVIWFYISQILAPMNHQLALYHDDIRISRSLLDPVTTLSSIVGLGFLFVTAIYAISRAPVLAFGILFFFVGHSIESTFLPLEIVHEHRNYLPSYGLIFALTYYVSCSFRFADSLRLRQAGAILFIGAFAFVTASRAQLWSDPLSQATAEVQSHPDSPRANSQMGEIYMNLGLADKRNRAVFLDAAESHYRRASQLRKSFEDGLFGLLVLSSKTKETMPDGAFEELIKRLRTQPFASNTVNWIDYLSKCTVNTECRISSEKMTTIIQAALANPTSGSRLKAELSTAAANYYFRIRDYDSALYLSAKASGERPHSARMRLNFVNMLIILGRIDDARTEFARAKLDDKYGAFHSEVNRLASILDAEN